MAGAISVTITAKENESDMARQHTEVLLDVLRGEGFAKAIRSRVVSPGLLRRNRIPAGLRDHLVGRRFEMRRRSGPPD